MSSLSDHRFRHPASPLCLKALGLFLLPVLFFSGCAWESQSAAQDETYQMWKGMAENSSGDVPAAPDFPLMRDFHAEEASALEATLPQPLPQIPVKNMVINRDMDIGTLLRALADAAGLNVILGNNVNGPIRVSLNHETRWDRLFLAITDGNGLHYELEEDLLRVYSLKDIENKIAMEQALHDQLQASKKRERSEPMVMNMIRIRYADLDNIANSVRSAMTAIVAEEAGQTEETATPGTQSTGFLVKADNDTGQIIIHGVPSDIMRARQLIQRLDQPTYQILIEASIVQANNEVARQLGVQWGVLDTSSDGSLTTGITPQPDGFNSNFPAEFDFNGPGFIYGASRVRGSQLLQAQLSALQRDGRLNIVSRPSITTLDQLTATIESGEERPFASAAQSGVGAVTAVEFKKATLRLEVTPHVIDNNWVKLDLNTTKDDFDDTRSIIIDGNVQVPILTRSAITSLYLANGQTTVIGGLSTDSQSVQERGVPFLKNIPGLGAMFRNQSNRDNFSDTLIFITPHILPRAGIQVRPQSK